MCSSRGPPGPENVGPQNSQVPEATITRESVVPGSPLGPGSVRNTFYLNLYLIPKLYLYFYYLIIIIIRN